MVKLNGGANSPIKFYQQTRLMVKNQFKTTYQNL